MCDSTTLLTVEKGTAEIDGSLDRFESLLVGSLCRPPSEIHQPEADFSYGLAGDGASGHGHSVRGEDVS